MGLVVSRKKGQTTVITDTITGTQVEVMVSDVKGERVSLNVSAPKHVAIHRKEVHVAIHRKEVHDAITRDGGSLLRTNREASPPA